LQSRGILAFEYRKIIKISFLNNKKKITKFRK